MLGVCACVRACVRACVHDTQRETTNLMLVIVTMVNSACSKSLLHCFTIRSELCVIFSIWHLSGATAAAARMSDASGSSVDEEEFEII